MGVSRTQVVRFLKKGEDAVSIIVSGDSIVFTKAGQVMVVSIEVYIGTEKLQYGSGSDNTFVCSTLSSGNKLFDGNGVWSFRIDETNTKFTYLIGLQNKVDLSTTIPYTITINDIPYNKSISVSTVYKGDRGATLRGPQDWEALNTGYQFYSGAEGEPYLDCVVYKDYYYMCKKSHIKSSLNFPGSSFDSNSGLWQLADNIDMVATKLLLATYIRVKNLGAAAIEMEDKEGNLVFVAKDGNVTCNTGTFENVNVQSGQIAGFKISGKDITNSGFNNNAAVVFRNDNTKCFAGIGGNVFPAVTGVTCVGRFENCDPNNNWGYGRNVALYIEADGADYNHAFIGKGNGTLNGLMEGFALQYVIPTSGGVKVTDISKGKYIEFFSGGNFDYLLPTRQNIQDSLDISSTEKFAIMLHYYNKYTSGGQVTLYGRTTAIGNANTSNFPYLYNANGSNVNVTLSKGDSVSIMVIYDGYNFFAQIMNIYQ